MDYIKAITQQVKKKLGELNEIEIVSIAIFGSMARQEADESSDVDLMIVAENIPQKRIHRIPEIIKIKRQFSSSIPLDILLVSKNECLLNFRNHNPLYLDITLDAKIIYDDDDFLNKLIAETHEYILANGIYRTNDSWSFPVKQRVATRLSETTNEEWALAWLSDGKRDLLAALHLLKASLFEKSVYHCQQAVEKGTKAILAAWGKFRRTHAVADILRNECEDQDIGEWKKCIIEIADIGDTIEPHVSLSRYPELANGTLWLPYEEYDAEIATEYLEKAKIVMKTSEKFIEWWFE